MENLIAVRGTINRDNPIPYYHQLKELIRDEISSGRWSPGSQIPSEPQLCQLFNVSRTVVRQALKELENEKLLRRRKGLGTFVNERKITGRLVQTLTGFHDDMLAQGLTPRTIVLSQGMIPASGTVAEQLHISPQSDVLRIERVRSVNDEPIVLVTTFLPADLCSGLEHTDLNDKSLYKAMEEVCGLRIAHGRRALEAISASESDARYLRVEEGEPLIYLRSVTYLADGRPIEYYEAKHRGDRTVLEVELVRTEEPRLRQPLAESVRLPVSHGRTKDR